MPHSNRDPVDLGNVATIARRRFVPAQDDSDSRPLHVRAEFADLARECIRYILSAPHGGCVFVAMAWLSHKDVWNTLKNVATTRKVLVLVVVTKPQKTSDSSKAHHRLLPKFRSLPKVPFTDTRLRRLFKLVPLVDHDATDIEGIPVPPTWSTKEWCHHMKECTNDDTCVVNDGLVSVRTCGSVQDAQQRGFNSLMHHKFIVVTNEKLRATSVWTGSFNATQAGELAQENVVVMHTEDDDDAAHPTLQKFVAEFARVFASSEGLLPKSTFPSPCLCPVVTDDTPHTEKKRFNKT